MSARMFCSRYAFLLPLVIAMNIFNIQPIEAQETHRPVLHGKNWVAITGKPLGATAGAKIFEKGGNAVDAAAAMLAATATMWDVLGWGGETQALIYNPNTGKVIGINALGVAPTGATPEFFLDQDMLYPPEFGPLAAVTPGTPGGLMTMVAEYGKLSLAEVLGPAIEMADGYPIEESSADNMERRREVILLALGPRRRVRGGQLTGADKERSIKSIVAEAAVSQPHQEGRAVRRSVGQEAKVRRKPEPRLS